jgi:hypothetical protein
MTPPDRRINASFNAFFAGLAALLGVVFVVLALLGDGVAWWLGAAAMAVVVWQLILRLRPGKHAK